MHDQELNPPQPVQSDKTTGDSQEHEASQLHSGCPELIQAAEKVISRTRLNWGIKDIQKASRLN